MAIEALGGEFRATKDLDIVLCVEALDAEFVSAFWTFVKAGQYEHRQKSTGQRQFYRFCGPKQPDYPAMLELFSRRPDAMDLAEGTELTPVPVDDQVASLSAILLDDAYYAFVMAEKGEVDGLTIVPASGLIPLKAHAFVDLAERKARGEVVDTKNIKKHRNDIYRIFAVMDRNKIIELPAPVRTNLERALARMAEEPMDLKPFGLGGMKVPAVIDDLKRLYGI